GSTTLKGAQVFGSSIELDAQSLHIESLQNRAAHQSRQYQGSAQITVGYGVSGSGDFSHSQIRADHASVAEQSGLFAGDGGYRVNVQNHTDLKGGLITSTEKAEAEHRNRFQTATLIHSDTHNHSKSKITRNPAAGRLRPTFNNTYKKIIINKVLHDMQRRRNMCST
ncbi:hemagglutinin repeat-containing protein, partial [Uruburuella suis]